MDTPKGRCALTPDGILRWPLPPGAKASEFRSASPVGVGGARPPPPAHPLGRVLVPGTQLTHTRPVFRNGSEAGQKCKGSYGVHGPSPLPPRSRLPVIPEGVSESSLPAAEPPRALRRLTDLRPRFLCAMERHQETRANAVSPNHTF